MPSDSDTAGVFFSVGIFYLLLLKSDFVSNPDLDYEVLWSWSTFKVSGWNSSLNIQQHALNFSIVGEYNYALFHLSFKKKSVGWVHIIFITLSDLIYFVSILILQWPSAAFNFFSLSIVWIVMTSTVHCWQGACHSLLNTLYSVLIWHSEF